MKTITDAVNEILGLLSAQSSTGDQCCQKQLDALNTIVDQNKQIIALLTKLDAALNPSAVGVEIVPGKPTTHGG